MSIPPYDPKTIHPLFPLFCPCLHCPYYQDLDNDITKAGTYSVKSGPEPRQRLYCHGGGHRFSETAYSPLFGRHGSFKEYVQTAKLSTYGLSTAQLADVLEPDSRTILQWQTALGQKSREFHLTLCCLIGLTLTVVQMDEIGSYLRRKTRQLWVFISFEARSKFWLNFELGSRSGRSAERLVKNLVYLMPWGFKQFLLVTTDKLAAYEKAIAQGFRHVRYAYLQIVKQRRKRRLVTVKQRLVKGKESDFPPKTKNTSYIERFNLTLRQSVSYLQRKTLGDCKCQVNFQWVLWMNLFNDNYCQFHRSLRQDLTGESTKFQRRYHHVTPAMQMGLTSTRLDWRDLIVAPIPENAHEFSTSTIL